MRISDWSSDVCSSDLASCRTRTSNHANIAHDFAKVRIVILQHRCGEGRGQFWSTGKASAKPFCNQQSDRTLLSVKPIRSEEHTSELQSLMRISYAVFCLKKKTQTHYQKKPPKTNTHNTPHSYNHSQYHT